MLTRYFLDTNSDVVTFSKEMYKTHVKKHNFLLSRKIYEVTSSRKKYELLVISYLTLSVMV
jgi:hypothetical protein